MKMIQYHRLSAFVLIGLLSLASGVTAHAVIVSSLVSKDLPQDSVNIVSSLSGAAISDGTTARYQSESSQRSITQTFVWNSDDGMTGLGLLISANQNSVSGQNFTTTQSFALDIQELDDASYPRKVKSGGTITAVTFNLTVSLVQAGQFLYIQFDTPLALENGKSYGFNFRPTEMVAANAVAIERASVAYTGGVCNQTVSVSTIADGAAYGNNSNLSYAFFTTAAIPEPASVVAFCGIAAMLAGVVIRLRRNS